MQIFFYKIYKKKKINICYCLQEKIRKRIHFHGTNWESLMTYIDQKALLKRHGGELDMPEGPFGMTLWESILLCEPFFKGNYLHNW